MSADRVPIDLSTRRAPRILLALLLMIAYLALRLPHLRDLPVFCDEASYLRWAQLIRQDPFHYLFTSLDDAKLPVHYWLLALIRPLCGDPVTAGRLLSVLLGALTIPALLALCAELRRLLPLKPAFAFMAAAMLITSPLMAIYQRMALAEPLLLLEAVTIAWLAARLARHAVEVPRRCNRDAVWLGLLWAVTLLTKQDFSYLLWMVPPLALLVTLRPATWHNQLKIFLPRYGLASAIGLAFFIPVLFANSTHDLRTLLFYKPVFTVNGMHLSRWTIFWQNAAFVIAPRAAHHPQWWPHDPDNPLESGLLYLYLTPPVLALAIGGAIGLVWRRQWRTLVFLGGIAAILVGPVLLEANALCSRYMLLAALPLLLIAACAASELLALIPARWPPARVLTAAATLAWPLACTLATAVDCRGPTWTRDDRDEFIASGTAGHAIEQAVGWFQKQHEPLTIVTRTGLGLANDFTWLMLRDQANIRLLCDDSNPPLRPLASGLLLVGAEQWVPQRTESIRVTDNQPIYFMESVTVTARHGQGVVLAPGQGHGSSGRLVGIFANHPVTPDGLSEWGIALYQLPPVAAPQASAR